MEGRDAHGRLLPGHHLFGKTKGIINGAKKTLKGEVRDALKLAEDAMPDIILMMIARARDPEDRQSQQAAEYLCDRIYGKANQPISNAGRVPFESFIFVLPSGVRRTSGELAETEQKQLGSPDAGDTL